MVCDFLLSFLASITVLTREQDHPRTQDTTEVGSRTQETTEAEPVMKVESVKGVSGVGG